MCDKLLFISVFNFGAIEMAKNHLKSLRNVGITNHKSFVTDSESYETIKSLGYSVHLIKNDDIVKDKSNFGTIRRPAYSVNSVVGGGDGLGEFLLGNIPNLNFAKPTGRTTRDRQLFSIRRKCRAGIERWMRREPRGASARRRRDPDVTAIHERELLAIGTQRGHPRADHGGRRRRRELRER